jgi:C_GCAxxG_C_C family probable redox protein
MNTGKKLENTMNELKSQRIETAEALHQQGFNCAQAVFSALAESLGFDQALARKIASPFGGGIGRTGETCGAVTGALMAMGLKEGFSEPDRQAKDNVYARTREFLDRFRERFGGVACRALIGVDISTPEGILQAREQGVFSTRCSSFIHGSVEIAEEMFVENR